jgi:hypothetical protein
MISFFLNEWSNALSSQYHVSKTDVPAPILISNRRESYFSITSWWEWIVSYEWCDQMLAICFMDTLNAPLNSFLF